MQDCVKI